MSGVSFAHLCCQCQRRTVRYACPKCGHRACTSCTYTEAQAWQPDPHATQHDDTPHLEDGRDNCNDWGTGEGQYHGRM